MKRFARPLTASILAAALTGLGCLAAPCQAQQLRGGLGGPASGAGLMPGAGFGQAGPGLVNPAGATPAAGFGQAGPGLVNPAGATPAAGGVGGPASGAGMMPGTGLGRPGLGR
jgi:hypothetical protein